ncbi:MAG: hypothetical protein L0H64_06215 [Pseudonocardia sp.]|nr:hypothetical protein [Pseudonocardia sp.]
MWCSHGHQRNSPGRGGLEGEDDRLLAGRGPVDPAEAAVADHDELGATCLVTEDRDGVPDDELLLHLDIGVSRPAVSAASARRLRVCSRRISR